MSATLVAGILGESMKARIVICITSTFLLFGWARSFGQQTVFNVPSADVLEKNRSYFEFDGVLGVDAASTSITPRTVRGMGHGMETGINFTSFNRDSTATVAAVPNFKWQAFSDAKRGLTVFTGAGVWLPIARTTYRVGDNAFLAVSKTFGTELRVAAGAYDYTAGTIDRANRGGAFGSVEETVNSRLGLAVDWFSGNNSIGYVSPGVNWKLNKQLTVFAASELGNHGLRNGNHAVLLVLGWNPTSGAATH
jgi:hypothetical protein